MERNDAWSATVPQTGNRRSRRIHLRVGHRVSKINAGSRGLRCCVYAGASLRAPPAPVREGPVAELELAIGKTRWVLDFSGSNASVAQLRIWADGTYRTADYGTFALDSGSLTIDPELRWRPSSTRPMPVSECWRSIALAQRPQSDVLRLEQREETLRGLPTVCSHSRPGRAGIRRRARFPAVCPTPIGRWQCARDVGDTLGAFATFSLGAKPDDRASDGTLG